VSPSEPVISVDRLSKVYRSGLIRKKSVHALAGVSVEANRGEIFGLLGPNGAGKTTLIKILLGVIHATGGSATLLGSPAGSLQARRRIGYLPESLRIDRHHTAWSALNFYGQMSGLGRETIRQRGKALLTLVGLDGRDCEPIRRFSKGMYQRLGIAQALLHDPDLLILDEPTDGLDPVGRNEIRRLLLTLKSRGKTIFLNSHILQEVELVCDRVAVMAGGKLRGIGTIEELTQKRGFPNVSFELAGPTSQNHLRELLASIIPSDDQYEPNRFSIEQVPSGTLRVSINLPDQAAIDKAIDLLRQNGISILAISTPRPSLEDAFLSLVGPQEAT
jgi:ABC-2 type transport system ATP-binding protein